MKAFVFRTVGWLAAAALSVAVGCAAPEPVSASAPGPAPGAPGSVEQAAITSLLPADQGLKEPDAGWGFLQVRIRWPQLDLPGFRAQTVPFRTRWIRLAARDGSGNELISRYYSRPIGPSDAASASFRVSAGNAISLYAYAFEEASPSAEAVPIAQGNSTPVTIQKSKVITVKLTLTALGAPIVDDFSPRSGPYGTAVRLTGRNFGATKGLDYSVSFGGFAADATRSGDGTIDAVVPSGAPSASAIVVKVDGVPSGSTGYFAVSSHLDVTVGAIEDSFGDEGLDVTVLPLDATYGDNGLDLHVTSGATAQGWDVTIQ